MLIGIVYNCNPETLDDIEQSDFVDAFENEIRVNPLYRNLSVNVTFYPGKSRVTSWDISDDVKEPDHESMEAPDFSDYAERAFNACCRQKKEGV